jgi:hypothetical protein
MKRTLLSLVTRRTALTFLIADIQTGLDVVEVGELEGYRDKLACIETDIAAVTPAIDKLKEDFNSPPATEQVLENRLIKQGGQK